MTLAAQIKSIIHDEFPATCRPTVRQSRGSMPWVTVTLNSEAAAVAFEQAEIVKGRIESEIPSWRGCVSVNP